MTATGMADSYRVPVRLAFPVARVDRRVSPYPYPRYRRSTAVLRGTSGRGRHPGSHLATMADSYGAGDGAGDGRQLERQPCP